MKASRQKLTDLLVSMMISVQQRGQRGRQGDRREAKEIEKEAEERDGEMERRLNGEMEEETDNILV